MRHRAAGAHLLRVVPGADHAFSAAAAVDTLGATLNDWLEGARRLTTDDSANWRLGATPAGKPASATVVANDADDEDDLSFFF